MEDQKRTFIAIALLLVIALGWQYALHLTKPQEPAPSAPPAASSESAKPGGGESTSPATAGAPASGAQAGGAAAAPAGTAQAPAVGAAPGGAEASAPAAPAVEAERSVPFSTPLFDGALSNRGALTSLKLKDYREAPEKGAPREPVSLATAKMGGETRQAQVSFVVNGVGGPPLSFVETQSNEIRLTGSSASGVETTLAVQPRAKEYALDYVLSITNKGPAPVKAVTSIRLGLAPSANASEGGWFKPPADLVNGLCAPDGKVERWVAKKAIEDTPKVEGAQFAGLDRQYFVVAAVPDKGTGTCAVTGEEKTVYVDYAFDAGEVAPGATWSRKVALFVGPKRHAELAAVSPALTETIDYNVWGIPLGFLARPMVAAMNVFHGWTGSWGLALILLVVVVKLLLFPVTYRSSVSMRRMQLLKPELDKLKEKFGDDRERMQMEQMKLFKEKGVNPLGGCLPMLLQMPVWFALYRLLWSSVDLYQQHFLWISDLTAPEPFPFLAISLGALTVLQQKLMPTSADNRQMKVMMYVMPLMFTVIMVSLQSGLVLYMVVNSILTILQQLVINRRQVSLS